MCAGIMFVAAFLKIPANLNNPQSLENLLETELEVERHLLLFQKQYSTFVNK